MNILRLSTVALTIVLFTMGALILPVNTALAHCKGPHAGGEPDCETHSHGGKDKDPPPTISVCDRSGSGLNKGFCIASVGKWHGRAASEYVDDADKATYTEIKSNAFGKILAGSGAATELCADYDVLIFEWDSPDIKNLDWDTLLDYMACGGGIIWEDTTNILKLHDDLTVVIINHDSSAPSPIEVAFDGDCYTDTVTETPSLCAPSSLASPFILVNSHIEFTGLGFEALALEEYLLQQDSESEVLGVYGVFPNGDGGCIVMTGPDNNFHGDANFESPSNLDLQEANRNMHALLVHELDWLLSDVCNP